MWPVTKCDKCAAQALVTCDLWLHSVCRSQPNTSCLDRTLSQLEAPLGPRGYTGCTSSFQMGNWKCACYFFSVSPSPWPAYIWKWLILTPCDGNILLTFSGFRCSAANSPFSSIGMHLSMMTRSVRLPLWSGRPASLESLLQMTSYCMSYLASHVPKMINFRVGLPGIYSSMAASLLVLHSKFLFPWKL